MVLDPPALVLRRQSLVGGGLAILVILAGCSEPARNPVVGVDDREIVLSMGDIYVDMRAPRSPWSVYNFSVAVVSPDGVRAMGTFATSPQGWFVDGGCDQEVSGDVRCNEPGRVGPYNYVRFSNVTYNGTWHIFVNRTAQGDPGTSVSGANATKENPCAFFSFSAPNRTFVDGPRMGNTFPFDTRGVSHAHIAYVYGGNLTIERYASDTCD